MLPFPRQRHGRDFGGCGNSLPLLLPHAESARAPALLPTLLPGLPRGLSGSPDPLPVPAAVWEPARAPGSRDALRPLPVPRLPRRFPPTPREAPVGLQMGQTVPLVQVLPPALGGRWGWKAPPRGGEGTREPRFSRQIKHHGAGLCVILRHGREARKLTQTHSKGWQKKKRTGRRIKSAHEVFICFPKLLGFSSRSRDSLGL